MKKDENYMENKRVYLQLLQEPISRMSSTSAIYKGFSAAVLAGLSSASFTEISIWALTLGLFPIVAFLLLDINYLSLERKLRFRYCQVAKDETSVTFLIDLELSKDEQKNAKSRFRDCIKSWSLWLFYGPVIGCSIALLILKWIGVI